MEIYIKPDKKIQVYKTGPVHIKDIAEIYAEKNLKKHIENIKIANIKENKN